MPIQTRAADSFPVLAEIDGLQILAGLNAVSGDEGSGKTHFLKQLCSANTGAFWLDLKLPEHSENIPEEIWQSLLMRFPFWNQFLCNELSDALDLTPHRAKRLFMLSAGSRRKVGLVALLASGAKITCLDQPYVALDLRSIEVLRDFLNEMSEDTSRAWMVADYEADVNLVWSNTIDFKRA
jgi:ATPase subunit of ABC transporter with duplicated ATPase domains